jgi:hypothetical protein
MPRPALETVTGKSNFSYRLKSSKSTQISLKQSNPGGKQKKTRFKNPRHVSKESLSTVFNEGISDEENSPKKWIQHDLKPKKRKVVIKICSSKTGKSSKYF